MVGWLVNQLPSLFFLFVVWDVGSLHVVVDFFLPLIPCDDCQATTIALIDRTLREPLPSVPPLDRGHFIPAKVGTTGRWVDHLLPKLKMFAMFDVSNTKVTQVTQVSETCNDSCLCCQ